MKTELTLSQLAAIGAGASQFVEGKALIGNLTVHPTRSGYKGDQPFREAFARAVRDAVLGNQVTATDPFAELKKAHAEGKIIEQIGHGSSDWFGCGSSIAWSRPPECYRIKPEPETFEAHGKTWTRHTLERIITAAHEAGWNGVENSKDLAQFIKDLAEEVGNRQAALIAAATSIDELTRKVGRWFNQSKAENEKYLKAVEEIGRLKGVQPDPYAELKKAHAEGKVIEVFVKDDEYGPDRWSKKENNSWTLPPESYRIKPDEPSTFEAHGKTWTSHTPGDPMPNFHGKTVLALDKSGSTWSTQMDVEQAIYWEDADYSNPFIGWRYADEQPAPETQGPNIEVSNPVQDMALGGQMHWRDLALQLAEVWWKCHSIGASLQHGDIDTDVSFTVCCELHGGRCFHADTPSNAWRKAEKWLMSPDRENFPALDAVKEVKP